MGLAAVIRLLAAATLLLLTQPVLSLESISANRECATCHIMWLTEFRRQDVTPLVPYDPRPIVDTGRQDVASTERMCVSCHDGFMLDSRFLWIERGHVHPVGVVPSERVKIPTSRGKQVFPLNEEGKLYCGTCHTAHGVSWEQRDATIFLRIKNVGSSLCVACHLNRSTGPDEGNHPIHKVLDNGLPGELKAAGSELGPRGDVICQTCHRPHGAPGERLLVIHNDRSQLCGNCHSDRYAKDRADAARLHTHPVNLKPDQAVVSETLTDAGARTGPDGEVICQTCHRPHQSIPQERILLVSNRGSKICLECHDDKRGLLDGPHKLEAEPGALTAKQQEAGAGPCAVCHRPHGGEGPKMWARPLAAGDEPISSACLSCHGKEGMAAERGVGEHSHPVGRPLAALPRKAALPGYDELGLRQAPGSGRLACASCHDPHLADDPTRGQRRFLRRPHTAENEICSDCHKEKYALLKSSHDLANSAPEAVNNQQKRVSEAGRCSACHLPHNGNGPRMWARNTPPKATDGVSGLCLDCHRDDGLARKKLPEDVTHPLGVSPSRLGISVAGQVWRRQDGAVDGLEPIATLPLFAADGHRTSLKQGGVGCATCHDPHGGNAAPFLRLANNRDGLCLNCHGDRGGVIGSRHDLREEKAAAEEQGLLRDKGACRACHRPHGGDGGALWARPLKKNEKGVAARCMSCHREGGLATEKQVGANSHPLHRPPPKGVKSALPRFDDRGRRDPKGSVDCASCHDPHRWQAGSDRRRDPEGDATNSFLRLPAAPEPRLCVECHQDKGAVVGTDHDLRLSRPEAASKGGVCASCHRVHNADSQVRLWGGPRLPGGVPLEEFCLGCHRLDGLAADKVPPNTSHPRRPVPSLSTLRGGRTPVPVFDGRGKRAEIGLISCPTCHDPHRWRPDSDKSPGRLEEGDASSSFLRHADTRGFLCSDCHGGDSIFRYKYFHWSQARQPHSLY